MLEELIERLERASEGSEELDAAIGEAVGLHVLWDAGEALYVKEKPSAKRQTTYNVPRYTRSLDAALTLVPAGLSSWSIRFDVEIPEDGEEEEGLLPSPGEFCAHIDAGPEDHAVEIVEWAKTPALALCRAALKARSAVSTSGVVIPGSAGGGR